MVTCRQLIPDFKQAYECCTVLWEIISAHTFCKKEFSSVLRGKSTDVANLEGYVCHRKKKVYLSKSLKIQAF
jgi:hypothetical protein